MGLHLAELILTLVVILLVFGVGRLPQIGEAIGKMRRNYSKSLKGEDAIDITPSAGAPREAAPRGKAGRGPEDAELVD